MAKIKGVAKRFSGDPVDYVLLFDWLSGKCLGKSVPDTLGNWSFSYYSYVNCGITYVADGCEPITHGAYEFPYNTALTPILHYPFDGNTKDYSDRKMDGILTGSVTFSEGRKPDTKSARFINGCVQTPSSLIINSPSVTISFWIKHVDLTSASVVAEIGSSFSASSSFLVSNNDPSSGFISSAHNTGLGGTHSKKSSGSAGSEWAHVLVDINTTRSGTEETKIYINNIDMTTSNGNDKDTSGDLGNGILYIGQRFASSLPLNGYLQDFRVYNRTLTAEERTLLFTE
ncbi:concanavalin A-like lectin [Psychrobacter phage vB_PmaS_Y8A]|nr:concanavalin A-like lectin [Psychrobacter phage vB_PmaS_Y8A]